jgi:trimethylamine:corrinoid methyltransferase-like protein
MLNWALTALLHTPMTNRQMYDTWTLSDAKTMNDRMREKVHWILKNHYLEPLPEDVLQELERILERAEASITDTLH